LSFLKETLAPLIVGELGRLDPGIEIFVEAMLAGHLVPLADFFVESHPGAAALLK
jgi:hypothetical protein